MSDFTPNEGEEEMLNVLLGKTSLPTLFLGLFNNSVSNFNSYGDAIIWANIVQATNFTGSDEKTITPANWVIPTGINKGNPATYPEQTFIADTGGASTVSGYYIRSSNNVLWVVGLHPDVEVDSIPKAMPAGAQINISPQFDLE